jgi:hypothetical protein
VLGTDFQAYLEARSRTTSGASTPVTGKTFQVEAGGDFQAALNKAQPGALVHRFSAPRGRITHPCEFLGYLTFQMAFPANVVEAIFPLFPRRSVPQLTTITT